MRSDLERKSRQLTQLLRHGANEAGLPMDERGFAPVKRVLKIIHVDEPTLRRIVDNDDKQRFQMVNGKIRACQGHSLLGTPVTLEGLESSWQRDFYYSPALLYHGTTVQAAVDILTSDGINAGTRTHVHLALSPDSPVGKRAAVSVLLIVDASKMTRMGHHIFKSPNGVYLVRFVPRAAITGVLGVSKAGIKSEAALRTLLPVSGE